MSVTIITHTREEGTPNLLRAQRSVQLALPSDGVHDIIVTPDYRSWTQSRSASVLSRDGYVGFVDDDDTIEPDAISLCIQALRTYGVGVAFTKEARVMNGRKSISPHASTYEDLLLSPTMMHHFVLIDSSKVPHDVTEAARRTGVGIDWYIKAATALLHGAVHVPYVGYNWYVDHPAPKISDRGLHVVRAPQIQDQIRTRWYGTHKGKIPIYR